MYLLQHTPVIMVRCLVLTILIEGFVAFIAGVRVKKDFLNITLVNVMTNPLVVSISTTCNLLYGKKGYVISMCFLELFALVSEALVYSRVLTYKKLNPFLMSLILNATSFLSGVLLNSIG